MNDTPSPDGDLVNLDSDKVEIWVDPSKIRVVLITAGSLLTFGALTLVSAVKLMSAGDFVGLWVLLQKEDTISNLIQLGGGAFFVWRLVRAAKKKGVEIKLAKSSPIAALTTDLNQPPIAPPGA